jgi:hypothetical protein
MSSQHPTGIPPPSNVPTRDGTYRPLSNSSSNAIFRSSPGPRPRLNAPIPGPAPYSVPASYTNNTASSSSPQVMGPPAIRLQTGLYPPQPSVASPFRPTPASSIPAFAQVEERPQDAEQLQDALASAGVDLKAEEFNLNQLLTPSSATHPQPSPFVFPPSYGGSLQIQQQIDDGKLIFNRPILSRFVDKIGITFSVFSNGSGETI